MLGIFPALLKGASALFGANQASKARKTDASRLQIMRRDAEAAGINPLAALGAGVASAYGGTGRPALTQLSEIADDMIDSRRESEQRRKRKEEELRAERDFYRGRAGSAVAGPVRAAEVPGDDPGYSGRAGVRLHFPENGVPIMRTSPNVGAYPVAELKGNLAGNPVPRQLVSPDGRYLMDVPSDMPSMEALEAAFGDGADLEGLVNLWRYRWYPHWKNKLLGMPRTEEEAAQREQRARELEQDERDRFPAGVFAPSITTRRKVPGGAFMPPLMRNTLN